MPTRSNNYYKVLTEAIADLTRNGFDSVERVAYWQQRLKEAAEATLTPLSVMQQNLRQAMTAIYARTLKGVAKYHPGVSRFTIDRIAPRLQAELTRRIAASADLIRLNRQQSIAKTLQRFAGWASSVPAGGSANVDKVETKTGIRKALASLPFEERRVLIDQGHKLTSNVNNIIAIDGGAIAVIWHSQWRRPGYNFRKDHKARDQLVYLIRDSWAAKAGLVKPGAAGYYDDVTAFGEEPFCSCYGEYIYNLRDLPEDMRTKKGDAELQRVREMIANVR